MALNFELFPFASGLIQKQAADELLKWNPYTARYGLELTPHQAAELVETRTHALTQTGRIEFGGGVLKKIIEKFCDSPYLHTRIYPQTLHELIEIFYYYKNETMDLISDDELLDFMKTSYDDVCQGSLSLLSDRELYDLARNLRFGLPTDHRDDQADPEEDEEEQDE